MKNFELNNDELIKDGKISVVFLQEEMKTYLQNVQQTVSRLLDETDLKGDAFADEFFNSVNEQALLEFANEDVFYTLSISRSYGVIDEEVEEQIVENFGANYLIEHRDYDSNLADISDFSLGEETELIEALHKFGLNLKGSKN